MVCVCKSGLNKLTSLPERCGPNRSLPFWAAPLEDVRFNPLCFGHFWRTKEWINDDDAKVELKIDVLQDAKAMKEHYVDINHWN